MKKNKWEMKAKIINLYLTVFLFKTEKKTCECEIIISCWKLKNTMKKKIKSILINIFILITFNFMFYYLLTLNIMSYRINRKISNLTFIITYNLKN